MSIVFSSAEEIGGSEEIEAPQSHNHQMHWIKCSQKGEAMKA